MNNVDKVSILKELEFYSRLLEKHTALKKQKELKCAAVQQTKINHYTSKPQTFQSYKVVKDQFSSTSLNQKYSFNKSSGLGIADQRKVNKLHNQRQNFNSKYSLSKNNGLNKTSLIKHNANSKNLNKVSAVNATSSSNLISESVKVPSKSSNESEQLTYSTKDFIKEVVSLTELLKKKSSSTDPQKVLNPTLKCDNATHNKQRIHNKNQNSAFVSTKLVNKKTTFSKTKCLTEIQSKMPANINYANGGSSFINSNRSSLKQKNFSVCKSVYKKDNVKTSLHATAVTPLKNINSVDELNRFRKITSRSTPRKVIFSSSKKISYDLCTFDRSSVFQIKPSSNSQVLIKKLHTPKNIPSAKKVLQKSPISKMKSPILLKIKPSNAVKVSKVVKLKQPNTRYRKINKHFISPDKRIQLEHPTQHRSSLKKNKKSVNSKYKVINKTLIPSLNKKSGNNLCTSVNKKNTSLRIDCDVRLETLNDSAVEKLEKNLLAISSELTVPLSSEKDKNSNSKVVQPFLAKASSSYKKTSCKKSKSRISKYKIINSNTSHSQKFFTKSMQFPHIVTPLKNNRTVLIRRLFKSKNVIINKNSSPTSYSAKMIKSKYLSFNKRKSNCQKYIYPAASQHQKFKGSYLTTDYNLIQRRYKTNAVSMGHTRLIGKANYGRQTYKLIYKKTNRQTKSRIKNRYVHTPVVFIRGTKYVTNLNGKTLRKLPIKGHTAKIFQRGCTKLVRRTPENFIKTIPASTNLASRVLHRSINRILTASSKKLSKVNTYCMFYNRFGRCNRGVKCTYIHDPSKIAVCTRFLRGTCKIDGCPFSHEVDPGKMAICSFYLVGQCEKEHCPYRHEKLSENAVLCKDFVQGYCCHGKECKKAHILICPKYMQGECDKGSLCAFPHPPQRAKKNVQKEVENEETKPTEVLLETVLRYFQQGGDLQNENINTNVFVPKHGKLEEQPSFIPLSDSPTILYSKK